MMLRALLPVLMLMSCAARERTPAPGSPGVQGSCDSDGLQTLVGKPGTQDVGAEALRLSKARTLRWTRPGQPVTMDYSPSRLNIELDLAGKVAGFSCG
jgi:hypothetical protein